MIYEFRTYDLTPRTLGEYQTVVDKALAGGRTKFSPLFGYWSTEFGPLNQVLHVWPYMDLEERRKVREQVANLGYWPPASGPMLAGQTSEIFFPAPFNDESIKGDRRTAQALPIHRRLVHRVRDPEQVGAHVGIQVAGGPQAHPGGHDGTQDL